MYTACGCCSILMLPQVADFSYNFVDIKFKETTEKEAMNFNGKVLRINLILFLTVFACMDSFGQKYVEKCVDIRESEIPPTIEDLIDDDSGFIGGTEKYVEFIRENLIINDSMRRYAGNTALVEVYINRQGVAIKYSFLDRIPDCKACNDAVIAVLRKITKWKPKRYFLEKNRKIYYPNFYLVKVKI